MVPKELETSLVWRHGLDWLPKFSPTRVTIELPIQEDCMTEMKVKSSSNHTLLVATNSSGIGKLIDCERYISY